MELNHPYHIYPNSIFSEYIEYLVYNNEIKRLNQYLVELHKNMIELKKNNKNRILIPFIIGSSMEVALQQNHTHYDNIFQYQQLFPNYINYFIEKNLFDNIYIYIIIVSPDKLIGSTNFTPLFLKYSGYNFEKTENKYIYSNNNIFIEVNIFNCPIPSIEKRELIIRKSDIILQDISFVNITSFRQTKNDINFINIFYNNFINICNINDYKQLNFIVNSYATFKNIENPTIYRMFPEILKICSNYNIIATEWQYIDEIFISKIVSNFIINNRYFINKFILYIDNFDIILEKIIDMNFRIYNINNIGIINFNSDIITL